MDTDKGSLGVHSTDEFGHITIKKLFTEGDVTKIQGAGDNIDQEFKFSVLRVDLDSLTVNPNVIMLPANHNTPEVSYSLVPEFSPKVNTVGNFTWQFDGDLNFSTSVHACQIHPSKPGVYHGKVIGGDKSCDVTVYLYDVHLLSSELVPGDNVVEIALVPAPPLPSLVSRPIVGAAGVQFDNPVWQIGENKLLCSIPAKVGQISSSSEVHVTGSFYAHSDVGRHRIYKIDIDEPITLTPIKPERLDKTPAGIIYLKPEEALECRVDQVPLACRYNDIVWDGNIIQPNGQFCMIHYAQTERSIKATLHSNVGSVSTEFQVKPIHLIMALPESVLLYDGLECGFSFNIPIPEELIDVQVEPRYALIEATTSKKSFTLKGLRPGITPVSIVIRVRKAEGIDEWNTFSFCPHIRVVPNYKMKCELKGEGKPYRIGDIVKIDVTLTSNARLQSGIPVTLTIPGAYGYTTTTENGKISFEYQVTLEALRLYSQPVIQVLDTSISQKVAVEYARPALGFSRAHANFPANFNNLGYDK